MYTIISFIFFLLFNISISCDNIDTSVTEPLVIEASQASAPAEQTAPAEQKIASCEATDIQEPIKKNVAVELYTLHKRLIFTESYNELLIFIPCDSSDMVVKTVVGDEKTDVRYIHFLRVVIDQGTHLIIIGLSENKKIYVTIFQNGCIDKTCRFNTYVKKVDGILLPETFTTYQTVDGVFITVEKSAGTI